MARPNSWSIITRRIGSVRFFQKARDAIAVNASSITTGESGFAEVRRFVSYIWRDGKYWFPIDIMRPDVMYMIAAAKASVLGFFRDLKVSAKINGATNMVEKWKRDAASKKINVFFLWSLQERKNATTMKDEASAARSCVSS
nr:hypothetical protein [Pseudomonas sagittaria]